MHWLQYFCLLFLSWNELVFFWSCLWLCEVWNLLLCFFLWLLVISLVFVGVIKNFVCTFRLVKIFGIDHDFIVYYVLLTLFLNNHIVIVIFAEFILVLSLRVKVRPRCIFVSHISLNNIVRVSPFFQSLCISKCVQSMVTRRFAWINTGNHDYPWLILVSCEGISENHCQFCLSKGNMASCHFTIHRSYAFFKSEQWFVDFSTLCSSFFVIMLSVLSSLRTCQINK